MTKDLSEDIQSRANELNSLLKKDGPEEFLKNLQQLQQNQDRNFIKEVLDAVNWDSDMNYSQDYMLMQFTNRWTAFYSLLTKGENILNGPNHDIIFAKMNSEIDLVTRDNLIFNNLRTQGLYSFGKFIEYYPEIVDKIDWKKKNVNNNTVFYSLIRNKEGIAFLDKILTDHPKILDEIDWNEKNEEHDYMFPFLKKREGWTTVNDLLFSREGIILLGKILKTYPDIFDKIDWNGKASNNYPIFDSLNFHNIEAIAFINDLSVDYPSIFDKIDKNQEERIFYSLFHALYNKLSYIEEEEETILWNIIESRLVREKLSNKLLSWYSEKLSDKSWGRNYGGINQFRKFLINSDISRDIFNGNSEKYTNPDGSLKEFSINYFKKLVELYGCDQNLYSKITELEKQFPNNEKIRELSDFFKDLEKEFEDNFTLLVPNLHIVTPDFIETHSKDENGIREFPQGFVAPAYIFAEEGQARKFNGDKEISRFFKSKFTLKDDKGNVVKEEFNSPLNLISRSLQENDGDKKFIETLLQCNLNQLETMQSFIESENSKYLPFTKEIKEKFFTSFNKAAEKIVDAQEKNEQYRMQIENLGFVAKEDFPGNYENLIKENEILASQLERHGYSLPKSSPLPKDSKNLVTTKEKDRSRS